MAANFGYHDSYVGRVSMALPPLDYDKDFVLAENSANTVVLQNITTPVDQPESIRFSIADVKDVYKNTDIQPLHRQNGLRGKKILVSIRDTARVSQDNVTVDYPIKVGVTLEYPISANIEATDLFTVVGRAVACTQDAALLGEEWDANEALINKLARGGLNPQDGVPLAA